MAEPQGNDLNKMCRPLSVGASGTYTSWSSGNPIEMPPPEVPEVLLP
jgi:hypothetical protein